MSTVHWTTVKAPTNIAIIKYWGKDNVEYNTPLNSSMSVTLDIQDMCAVTTVAASLDYKSDCLWLNGKPVENAASDKRFRACIDGVKALATDTNGVTKQQWQNEMKYHVSSYNTFPTAAGLASSAAGYAALVAAMADLVQAKEEYPYQLSTIARQGSGSACRSLYGGLVAWWACRQDENDNDSLDIISQNSKAEPLLPADHWPDMRILVLVAQATAKHTPSTSGMQTSVKTSPLLQYRAKHIVPQRMQQMHEAWKAHDFEAFGKLCMQDSNQFHATCLDTYPPIAYLNDVSHTVIRMVHAYNEYKGSIKVTYTFDAGPNAVLYGLEPDLSEFKQLAEYFLTNRSGDDPSDTALLQAIQSKVPGLPNNTALQRTIWTRIGSGPQVCKDICNIDLKTGESCYKAE